MNFESHLLYGHGLTPSNVEPSETPGYWQKKTLCGGAPTCPEPLHSTFFNQGPTHHTISFFDHGRDARGRWTSPYATWRASKAMAALEGGR